MLLVLVLYIVFTLIVFTARIIELRDNNDLQTCDPWNIFVLIMTFGLSFSVFFLAPIALYYLIKRPKKVMQIATEDLHLSCPYCREQIGRSEKYRTCSSCNTIGHLQCWKENAYQCFTFGCSYLSSKSIGITT